MEKARDHLRTAWREQNEVEVGAPRIWPTHERQRGEAAKTARKGRGEQGSLLYSCGKTLQGRLGELLPLEAGGSRSGK